MYFFGAKIEIYAQFYRGLSLTVSIQLNNKIETLDTWHFIYCYHHIWSLL